MSKDYQAMWAELTRRANTPGNEGGLEIGPALQRWIAEIEHQIPSMNGVLNETELRELAGGIIYELTNSWEHLRGRNEDFIDCIMPRLRHELGDKEARDER